MKILIDPKYDPNTVGEITSATKLGPGISMAKFLGAKGSRTQLEKLYNESFTGSVDRLQLARNLTLHAQILQSIVGMAEYSQHRLIVSEGVYEPNPKFEVTEKPAFDEGFAKFLASERPGATYGKSGTGWVVRYPNYIGEIPSDILALRRKGQAVVYQLIDRNGKTDPQKTFDLAVYWKDYINYDKLTLDYDTYDPSGELTCQIVIETPEVPENYDVSYKYNLETLYNGQLQTKNELLEILSDD